MLHLFKHWDDTINIPIQLTAKQGAWCSYSFISLSTTSISLGSIIIRREECSHIQGGYIFDNAFVVIMIFGNDSWVNVNLQSVKFANFLYWIVQLVDGMATSITYTYTARIMLKQHWVDDVCLLDTNILGF